MAVEKIELWTAEIADDMKKRFGINVNQATPIDKGWLNVKWKMESDQGPLFVKFYHPDRYKLHLHPDKKAKIQLTLELQHGLNKAGVKCPDVQLYQRDPIHVTSSGLYYAVLGWVEGYTAPAGSLNIDQLFELGQETGKMHRWLRSVQPLDKPAWQPNKAQYMNEWRNHWNEAEDAKDEIVLGWLRRSHQLVDAINFEMFDASPVGWLHWDLWVDNILLSEKGVAGIVDFDRMSMAYQEIDVARAILSGALQDDNLRIDAVQSFMEGYREYVDIPRGNLVRALGMLYLIESIWWLRTEVRKESNLRGLLRRFIEEMHWIEDHWDMLPEQLAEI